MMESLILCVICSGLDNACHPRDIDIKSISPHVMRLYCQRANEVGVADGDPAERGQGYPKTQPRQRSNETTLLFYSLFKPPI